jgi:hypothetical protein
MFDFKYHIVSLVAVFLALGIGVVMGSMSADRGVVTTQEKSLIATMEKDFENLRATNKDQQATIAASQSYIDASLPLLVSGKLTGKSIAVVVTGDVEAPTLKVLKAALEKAGAVEASITYLAAPLGLDNKDTLAKVGTLVGAPAQSQAIVSGKVLQETALAIVTGSDAAGIAGLANAGVLKITGSYAAPATGIIIIGGSENGKYLKFDELDKPLIKAFQATGLSPVGVESSTVKNSYMKSYQDLNLSTIDDIDQAAGQVSLVYVLAGRAGNFGGKSTADTLMPAPKSL